MELVRTGESYKVQLAELEETLLQALAAAEGNILENKTLLASLNETKLKSSVISESLSEASLLQVRLDHLIRDCGDLMAVAGVAGEGAGRIHARGRGGQPALLCDLGPGQD